MLKPLIHLNITSSSSNDGIREFINPIVLFLGLFLAIFICFWTWKITVKMFGSDEDNELTRIVHPLPPMLRTISITTLYENDAIQ